MCIAGVSPGHVPSCWELCPFPGRSPSHAGLCLISDTDSRQRNRDPGSLPRLGAPLPGPPIPTTLWGIGTAGITVQLLPVPSPTSLIHKGVVPECVCPVAQLLSCIQLIVTLWTVAHQALQARILEWVAFPPPVVPESAPPTPPPQISLLDTQFHPRVCILGTYVSYLTMNSQGRTESITSKTTGKPILN